MPELNIKKLTVRKRKKINIYNFSSSFSSLISRAGSLVFIKEKVLSADVNIVLISDKEIKKLNKKYRKVNRITDVISFKINTMPLMGDIYIAEKRSKRQAKEQGHSWKKEISYLVIHGILHLCGYTDYKKKEKKKMFRKQDKIFKCLFS